MNRKVLVIWVVLVGIVLTASMPNLAITADLLATPTPVAPPLDDEPPAPADPAATAAAGTGQVLQLLTVPANGDEKTSMALASGTAYTIRVSGVFMFGHCDPSVCPGGGPDYIRWSDAGRRTDNHFSSVYAAMYVGLEINGILIAFSSYHQDHTYTVARTGNGQALKFRLRDCVGCYGDNAGQLRVEILTGSPAATLLPVKHFQ